MRILPSLRALTDFLLHRSRVEREMEEELRLHLRRRADDLRRQGLPRAEAERQARIEFGGYQRYKEECREALGIRLLGELIADARYGRRQLRRNPGFTAVAVITLALGIGANTAIFTVVNGVLLRPLPIPHPERVLWIQHIQSNCPDCFGPLSYSYFRDFQNQNTVFQGLTTYVGGSFNPGAKGNPQRVVGAFVAANYFTTMMVRPTIGRVFLPREDKAGHNHVAVISAGLWQREFGGDPDILGKSIYLDDESATVVGVMPGWCHLPFDGVEVWTPLVIDPADGGMNMYDVVGRLKPGVTLAEARAQMGAIAARLAVMDPKDFKDETVRMWPLQRAMVLDIHNDLLVLMVAVAFVFLIASANVINLMLARTAARQREIAVRLSVGAGRGRLFRQFLTESLLLAASGAVLGWPISVLGVDALLILRPANLLLVAQIHADAWVLGFTIALVMVAAVALGVAAARRAFHLKLHETLKEAPGTEKLRQGAILGRNALVVGEVAIAVTLLVGASLLVKSLWRLLQVKPGLDPEHVLSMRIPLPRTRYSDEAHIAHFYGRLLRKVQALPGVEEAGVVSLLPLQDSYVWGDFEVAGRPRDLRDLGQGMAELRGVSPDYYRTLGIPLLQGRFFGRQDQRDSAPVVIINEQLAKRYWPHENPIGRRIEFGEPPWYTIVGIVDNVRQFRLSIPVRYETDVPYTQWPRSWGIINGTMSLVLRTRIDPTSMAGAARRAVLGIDPDQPVFNVETMRQVVSHSVKDRRFYVILLGVFAALGMILASLGIYGMLSYMVTQRTHEIGVRMALGAQKRDVLRLVVGQGMVLAVVGVGIGIVAALGLTRFVSTLLYDVKPTDAATLIFVSLLLTGVALLACYIPACRAAKVDPMVALRYE